MRSAWSEQSNHPKYVPFVSALTDDMFLIWSQLLWVSRTITDQIDFTPILTTTPTLRQWSQLWNNRADNPSEPFLRGHDPGCPLSLESEFPTIIFRPHRCACAPVSLGCPIKLQRRVATPIVETISECVVKHAGLAASACSTGCLVLYRSAVPFAESNTYVLLPRRACSFPLPTIVCPCDRSGLADSTARVRPVHLPSPPRDRMRLTSANASCVRGITWASLNIPAPTTIIMHAQSFPQTFVCVESDVTFTRAPICEGLISANCLVSAFERGTWPQFGSRVAVTTSPLWAWTLTRSNQVVKKACRPLAAHLLVRSCTLCCSEGSQTCGETKHGAEI